MWCSKALKNDPENAKAIYRIGNAFLACGDFVEAEEAFRTYRDLAPNDAEHADAMVSKAVKRRNAAKLKQRNQLRGFMG
jgi:Flp pilus assembly protein TadD